eukprot:354857-Chlamydomonas_euryale.AAC.25
MLSPQSDRTATSVCMRQGERQGRWHGNSARPASGRHAHHFAARHAHIFLTCSSMPGKMLVSASNDDGDRPTGASPQRLPSDAPPGPARSLRTRFGAGKPSAAGPSRSASSKVRFSWGVHSDINAAWTRRQPTQPATAVQC